MVADELDYVIGVDTHRDEHMLAVITAPVGAIVAGVAVRANMRGYRDALRLAERYAAGRRVWAIEGSGSYGAGLARFLSARGETVLEQAARRELIDGCAVKTTLSMRNAPHARSSRARRSHCRARASDAMRCACCWSHDAARSTSAARRSANFAR